MNLLRFIAEFLSLLASLITISSAIFEVKKWYISKKDHQQHRQE